MVQHDVTGAHAEYYLALAEAAQDALLNGPGQAEWLDRLAIEEDNLRAAAATFASTGCHEAGLRLVRLLLPFWELRGDGREGVAIRAGVLVEHAPDDLASGRRAGLVHPGGVSSHGAADADRGSRWPSRRCPSPLNSTTANCWRIVRVTISHSYCSSGEREAALRRTNACSNWLACPTRRRVVSTGHAPTHMRHPGNHLGSPYALSRGRRGGESVRG